MKVTLATKLSYRWMFKGNFLHSVRDSYTESLMKGIGINNVVNTGCPTMWSLTPDHCRRIRRDKADKVVFTLTDYKPDPQRDEYLISVLMKKYDEVYFWPQGHKDFAYLQTLQGFGDVRLINPHLKDYDDFLSEGGVDFVGTRLHGGIRALQHGCRTIIIGIDNRAKELHNDFNLPVLFDSNMEDLGKTIENDVITNIKLPVDNIRKYLSQFSIEYHA